MEILLPKKVSRDVSTSRRLSTLKRRLALGPHVPSSKLWQPIRYTRRLEVSANATEAKPAQPDELAAWNGKRAGTAIVPPSKPQCLLTDSSLKYFFLKSPPVVPFQEAYLFMVLSKNIFKEVIKNQPILNKKVNSGNSISVKQFKDLGPFTFSFDLSIYWVLPFSSSISKPFSSVYNMI